MGGVLLQILSTAASVAAGGEMDAASQLSSDAAWPIGQPNSKCAARCGSQKRSVNAPLDCWFAYAALSVPASTS
ncbi:hypothetical protein PR003_g20969 [Phytophthora rubi]|uniref:Secreted protein n=1 Tax=Phytophthora rubi TaxID=129364 RepID=A0A6A4DK32_9STRA|nr:hypothetical protein PR002_g19771 [Phytophthora rubi]KAE9307543.1 hypothetical protein PR003_g20969 [Phytophthora rubi]